jgi:RP/EB family microtubule-associated protein
MPVDIVAFGSSFTTYRKKLATMAGVDQKIGMMDGAYFVGRKDILDWINGQLNLSLSKVEETASGCVACQMLDVMYPGKVPMSKVNWGAKVDYEFIQNYKVLQTCFTKLKIDRHIEVDKLVRAKYQDNLEFMQWFKRFFELNMGEGNPEYDAIGARAKGKGSKSAKSGNGVRLTKASGGDEAPKAAPRDRRAAEKSKQKDEPVGEKENVSNNSKPRKAASRARPSANSGGSSAADTKKIEELQGVNSELKLTVDGLEKERDFYFGKLRDIEIMLQGAQEGDAPVGEDGASSDANSIQRIFKILYACDENDDFAPENDAEVVPEGVESN